MAKLSFLIQPAACREAELQCAERALGTWHVCVRAAARVYECLIALGLLISLLLFSFFFRCRIPTSSELTRRMGRVSLSLYVPLA